MVSLLALEERCGLAAVLILLFRVPVFLYILAVVLQEEFWDSIAAIMNVVGAE